MSLNGSLWVATNHQDTILASLLARWGNYPRAVALLFRVASVSCPDMLESGGWAPGGCVPSTHKDVFVNAVTPIPASVCFLPLEASRIGILILSHHLLPSLGIQRSPLLSLGRPRPWSLMLAGSRPRPSPRGGTNSSSRSCSLDLLFQSLKEKKRKGTQFFKKLPPPPSSPIILLCWSRSPAPTHSQHPAGTSCSFCPSLHPSELVHTLARLGPAASHLCTP